MLDLSCHIAFYHSIFGKEDPFNKIAAGKLIPAAIF
jgi:hypothetical protein